MALFRRMASQTAVVATDPQHTSRVFAWRSRLFEVSFDLPPPEGLNRADLGEVLKRRLERLCAEAEKAVREDGVSLLIISDRCAGPRTVPVPSLLSLGAVHQHLLKCDLRMRVGLIVESGDAR